MYWEFFLKRINSTFKKAQRNRFAGLPATLQNTAISAQNQEGKDNGFRTQLKQNC
jgi:hypothetical protein